MELAAAISSPGAAFTAGLVTSLHCAGMCGPLACGLMPGKADKADPNNGARLADSTLAMRRSVYKRYLEGPFGKLKLDEISPAQLMKHCESIREKGASAPAVQVREIVLLVYRFAVSKDKSLTVVNPAEAIRPSDIATFKARDRALNPTEIRRFLAALDTTATAATLRLALRFVMLTMVRKGEFIIDLI